MFLSLVAVYLALFIILAVAFSSREGYWSPVTIFGITAFYYYLALPLELYLKDQEVFSTYPALFLVTDESRLRIAIAALLGFLGFVTGHHLSGLGQVLRESHQQALGRVPRSLAWFFIGSLGLLFLVYGTTVFERLSYMEAAERKSGDSFFGFITKNCLILFGLLAATVIQRRDLSRHFAIPLLTPIIYWGFFTSDKNPLLIAALAVSVIWVGVKSSSTKHLYFYCTAAVLAIASLPLFSALRAGQEVQISSAFTNFSIERTDARGPLMSLSAVMANEEPVIHGRSYLQGLVSWVPRTIWPNRPKNLAQEFAVANIPNWNEGMGLGYSLLAEGYVNFGYSGVFVHYLLLALIMGLTMRATYTLCKGSGDTSYWRALVVIVYFQLLVLMHRGPVSQVIQISIHEFVVPVFLFWILDRNNIQSNPTQFSGPSLTFNTNRAIRAS